MGKTAKKVIYSESHTANGKSKDGLLYVQFLTPEDCLPGLSSGCE